MLLDIQDTDDVPIILAIHDMVVQDTEDQCEDATID